jgi:hypothetical protein
VCCKIASSPPTLIHSLVPSFSSVLDKTDILFSKMPPRRPTKKARRAIAESQSSISRGAPVVPSPPSVIASSSSETEDSPAAHNAVTIDIKDVLLSLGTSMAEGQAIQAMSMLRRVVWTETTAQQLLDADGVTVIVYSILRFKNSQPLVKDGLLLLDDLADKDPHDKVGTTLVHLDYLDKIPLLFHDPCNQRDLFGADRFGASQFFKDFASPRLTTLVLKMAPCRPSKKLDISAKAAPSARRSKSMFTLSIDVKDALLALGTSTTQEEADKAMTMLMKLFMYSESQWQWKKHAQEIFDAQGVTVLVYSILRFKTLVTYGLDILKIVELQVSNDRVGRALVRLDFLDQIPSLVSGSESADDVNHFQLPILLFERMAAKKDRELKLKSGSDKIVKFMINLVTSYPDDTLCWHVCMYFNAVSRVPELKDRLKKHGVLDLLKDVLQKYNHKDREWISKNAEIVRYCKATLAQLL